jgi:hypothetical protein
MKWGKEDEFTRMLSILEGDPVAERYRKVVKISPELKQTLIAALRARCRMFNIDLDYEGSFFSAPPELPPLTDSLEISTFAHGLREGQMFRLPTESLPLHVLVQGSTGSLKSTFTNNKIVGPCIEKKIPVWAFDPSPGGTEFMGNILKNRNVFACRYDEIFINLCKEEFHNYFSKLISIMGEAWWGLVRFADYTQEHIAAVKRKRSIFTLLDVLNSIRQDEPKGPKREFKLVSERILNQVTRAFPNFCVSEGMSLEKLKATSLMIDTSSLSDEEMIFFVSVMLFLESESRDRNYSNQPRKLIVIDEGHRIFSSSRLRQKTTTSPYAFLQVQEARKKGIAIVICDNGLLPVELAMNLGTQIIFQINDGEAIRNVARGLKLVGDEYEEYLRLSRQEFILRYPQFHCPILLKTPTDLKFVEPTDEQAIAENKRRFFEEFPFKKESEVTEIKTNPQPLIKIEPLVRKVLMAIAAHPTESIEQRFLRLGIDRDREGLARTQLLRDRLIEHSGQVGKTKFFSVTQRGKEIAKRLGVEVATFKSCAAHQHVVDETMEGLQRAFPEAVFDTECLRLEGPGDTIFEPDLGVTLSGGRRLLCEVIYSGGNLAREAEKAHKIHRAGVVDRLILVTCSKTVFNSLERKLRESFPGGLPDAVVIVDAQDSLKATFDWQEFLGLGEWKEKEREDGQDQN